jgi:hypothetical protein
LNAVLLCWLGLSALVLTAAALNLGAQTATGDWQRESVLNGRRGHAVVYVTRNRHILLFGGSDRNQALNDTWIWDDKYWHHIRPSKSPDPRYGHALAYDYYRKRVVLFGGQDETGALGDTWEWNNQYWYRVSTSTAPPARHGHVMAYDMNRRRTILFGGEGGLEDTWEYDGRRWRQVAPPGAPPALSGAAMTYDPVRKVVVLFGGKSAEGYSQSTWTYNGARWTEHPAGSPTQAPPGRREHVLAFCPKLASVVLFGGYFYDNGPGKDTWLNDLWAWNGSTWTLVSAHDPETGPSPRYRHAAAYKDRNDQFVMFGGSYDNERVMLLSDTWVYRFDGTGWVDMSAQSPSPRRDLALSYDLEKKHVVLFGGDDGEGPLLDDTWIWDNAHWHRQSPAVRPTGRRDHTLIYDAWRGHHFLFGGDDGNQRLRDCWTFDGATWKQVEAGLHPPARSRHAMEYMVTRNAALLFGGFDGLLKLGDTWKWNGTVWTSVSSPSAPERRSRHAMAFDILRGRMVLFGGKGPGEVELGDTWEYVDGQGWKAIAVTGETPSPRHGHVMVYDLLRRCVVLHGGQDRAGRLSDTWAWDGKQWTTIETEDPPPVRSRHDAVYNTGRLRTFMFGGLGDLKNVSDSWSLVSLRLSVTESRLTPGETVEFIIDSLEEQNQNFVCGLAFEKTPGVPLPLEGGLVDLPLFPDALTMVSLYLPGFVGKLDPFGKSRWWLNLVNDEALIGLRFYASMLTFDDQGRLRTVSNEVAVEVIDGE